MRHSADIRLTAAGVLLAIAVAMPARAQLVPNDRWYTIETAHFRVHFTRPLEDQARRGAVDAERAWAQLATELKPPAGKVDLVIADNLDYVNGYASVFPSNRIVIFAHPPIDTPELRNYEDWSQLVITHELTHVFHLDRAEGFWRVGRRILGRHPAFFPNAYQPAWLVEGLAVYYESRITGAGRLEGDEHYMIARAAAEAHAIPRLGELSRSTSRFPGGETVYAYGGQLFDYLSRTRGPETIPKFLDITSTRLLPISLNRRAKRAFGISFENAFRDWSDSLVRASRPGRDPMIGWRELTREGRYVAFPRWLGDTAILYTAATGKEITSAYSVTLDGKVRRLGRRNGLDVNVPFVDGSILFAQTDYTDPFHVRTDLYLAKDGQERRLTRGARLAHPDARPDGAIVAVQSIPGSTRLVRVSADGRVVQPITVGTDDVQWGEPRWSPDGAAIAAIRVLRSGNAELVVLDTLGTVRHVVVSDSAIVASPSWSPSGDAIYYTSTAAGASQVFITRVDAPAPASTMIVSRATTGMFSPALSPDGGKLAARSFRFDGYHVGYAASAGTPVLASEGALRKPRTDCRNCRLPAHVKDPISLTDLRPARSYSPWRSLLPHFWEPVIAGSTDEGLAFGAATSGEDVIGRHSYYTELLFNGKHRETEGIAAYQYAGFGQPFINASAQQEWEHFSVVDAGGAEVGDLARRARIASLSASFVRPRARTFSSFSFGGDIETRTYGTDPDTLLAHLSSLFGEARRYPSIFASAGWTNTKRPALSISREDGVSLSATTRQRWEAGAFGDASRSVIGVASAYKSLNLPGFAHHVIAVRGAAGYADRRAISSFSAGGLSGGSLDVIAGYTVGGGRRTFGIRGFPPSAEQGIRALAASIEYRAPLAAPSRRYRFVPLLLDRVSAAAFADAGRAYCPASSGQSSVCSPYRGGPWLASSGAELDFDTALQYDVPARIRTGFAVPVANRHAGRANAVSFYFTLGTSF